MRRLSGAVDEKSMYKETFDIKFNSMTDLRIKPTWYQELTTPFGQFAEGHARRLGEQPRMITVV